MSAIIVKTVLGTDIRRFRFPEGVPCSYENMLGMVRSSYGVSEGQQVLFAYLDDEGDKCRIATEEEMTEALRLSQDKKLLKIMLDVQGEPDSKQTEVIVAEPVTQAEPVQVTQAEPEQAAEPEAQAQPEPEPEPEPKLDAKFVEDVTVPDDSVVQPDSVITKTWKIQNDGTLNWPEGTMFTRQEGNLLEVENSDEEEAVLVSEMLSCPIGETIDVTVKFKTAGVNQPGKYSACYRLGANGESFGDFYWIRVEVMDTCPPETEILARLAAFLADPSVDQELKALAPEILRGIGSNESTESLLNVVLANEVISQHEFVKLVQPFLVRAMERLTTLDGAVREMLCNFVVSIPMKLLRKEQEAREQEAREQATSAPEEKVPAENVHDGIICDGCEMNPIIGERFKCIPCANYDLCAKCHANAVHGQEHAFRKIEPATTTTNAQPVNNNNVLGVLDSVLRMFTAKPKENSKEETKEPKEETKKPKEETKKPKKETMKPKSKLRAKFVKDVTMDDGASFEVGSAVNKVWTVQNIGKTAWPETVQLECESGDLQSVVEAKTMVPVTQPGEVVEIAIPFVMPQEEGRKRAFFRMSSEGQKFGPRLWIDVQGIPVTKSEAEPEQVPEAEPVVMEQVPEDVQDVLEPLDVQAEEVDDGSSHQTPVNLPKPVVAWAYPEQMALLAGMGFTDEARNNEVLLLARGDVNRAMDTLLR